MGERVPLDQEDRVFDHRGRRIIRDDDSLLAFLPPDAWGHERRSGANLPLESLAGELWRANMSLRIRVGELEATNRMMQGQKRARRVTITLNSQDEFRYNVQGGNWKTIDASEEGLSSHKDVLERIAARWPHTEELEDYDGICYKGNRNVRKFLRKNGFLKK